MNGDIENFSLKVLLAYRKFCTTLREILCEISLHFLIFFVIVKILVLVGKQVERIRIVFRR